MNDPELRERTKRTAQMLFHSLKGGTGFETWKKFDKDRPHELRAHIHAALNVGATREQVAEVIFQQVTYGGMPVVVDALDVFKAVLEERGEWEG